MTLDRAAVAEAVRRLGGTERLLVYDVPLAEAPERPSVTSPYVNGPDAWWRFIDRRRALDDGADLSLLVSLRRLSAAERMLVVSWGTAYANSFLLVEPADPALDLTTDAGVAACAAATGSADADACVRSAYAEWVYWRTPPEGERECLVATLDVSDPDATLWRAIWDRLPSVFPPATFLSFLTLLNLRETELFTGGRPVARAVVPFLTRLGLPIVWDAWLVIAGVRKLVDAGLAWVQDPQDHMRVYRGPIDTLPPSVSDERLATMLR